MLMSWLKANKLTLNIPKTCFSIYHSSHKPVDDKYNTILLNNEIIKRVQNTVYLGMTIDETLSWNVYFQKLIQSLSKYFGIFNRLKNHIPKHLKRQVLFSYIYSRVSYGIEVYGCCSQTLLGKLQVVCNKLVKIFCNKDRLYSTSQLHKDTNLLKVADINKVAILKFVHKCMNGSMIPVFRDYFNFRHTMHNVNIRVMNKLSLPKTKTKFGTTAIRCTGASLWNSLPQNIITITESKEFTKQITAYFSDSYQMFIYMNH